MKKYIKAMLTIVLLCGLIAVISPTFAYIYNRENTISGLRNIQPNDELNFPDNTVWASLTAVWGVRVEFLDYDESVIKSEVVEVSDKQEGNTIMPNDPKRKEYKFLGWTRYDDNSGQASINDDGTLSDICGPGPIIYIAKYEKVDDKYKVDYFVEEDKNWGVPTESITPIDTNSYVYNDKVTVLIQSKSLKGYAFDDINERNVHGTWILELDEENDLEINDDNEFYITDDTEVKGTWVFNPDPVKLKYSVIKDKSWGEPSDNIIDSSETEYQYNDKVKVVRSISPYKGTALDKENGKTVLGTWKYDVKENVDIEYDEEDEFNILENTAIEGTWKFVPDKLRVEYVAKPDNNWGEPENGEIPTDYNLYNYKDNINIVNKKTSIKGTATNLKTGKKVDGEWVLVVDDTDTIITENKTIDAQWVFYPNTETNPKTGDNILLYISTCIISVILLFIFGKEYLKNRKSN